MAIKSIIRDNDGNELDCFINTKGNVVVTIKNSETPHEFSLISLEEKEDIDHLIERLTQLKKELK